MNTSFQRTTASDEWYTPKEIVDSLGKFDLDPCAPTPKFYTAEKCYDRFDDGLSKRWSGRVWLNPPYSRPLIVNFIQKMSQHSNGIALLFNRMDSKMWHDIIFPTATAMLVMRGRIAFCRPDGTQGSAGGCGAVFVAWGEDNAECLRKCNIEGKFINLK